MSDPLPPLDPATEPSTPAPRRGRRVFAGFATVLGLLLIGLEMRSLADNGSVGWFWLVVGGLLLLMGLAELLLPGPQRPHP